MLSTIADFADGRTNAVGLTEALLAHEADVLASARRSERAQVSRAEVTVQADPSKCFRFDDDGRATLQVPDRTWHAGRFRAPLLAETGFDGIRVGVHDDIEVAFGYDWDGRVSPPGHRIAQVFTSTLAGGGYGDIDDDLTPACRHLLRAAYLGTLLAAAELGKHNVVLTLIGGGAFANPLELIWESILWAVETVDALAPTGLHAFVNARRDRPPETVLAAVRRRDGAVVEWQAGRPIPG